MRQNFVQNLVTFLLSPRHVIFPHLLDVGFDQRLDDLRRRLSELRTGIQHFHHDVIAFIGGSNTVLLHQLVHQFDIKARVADALVLLLKGHPRVTLT